MSLPENIIHVVPALFGGAGGIVGGAERYVLELARHMANAVATTLVSFADESGEESIGGLRIRKIGKPTYVRGQRANPFSLRLLKELRTGTVIHCHQQHIVASSAAAAYARLTGRRVFVSDLGGGGWDISHYVSTDRWYHGHLHISEYSRKVFGHANAPWARVILGGVDTVKFAPQGNRPRQEDRAVLFVGRLLPHKGVDDLVEAMPPDMPLRVAGRPYDERFFVDLRRLAEGKRVSFETNLDDAGLAAAYRDALCVVLPSVYRTRYGLESAVPELLGQTLLEGMASGVPAICTDVASMPEVVEHGVSGFVVPPNDPAALRERLLWLRGHPAEAARMGEAARRRVLDKFTWQAVVERCLAAYRGQAEP